ncbi:MAG: TIGR03668 family PPOX class F420-dependent oxidoreductase [Acidimicrobiia bacterium]|nr:TIGR03668 family PPOX class F420-dependent oxidoreductase [Acidimicrobiia bacterium]
MQAASRPGPPAADLGWMQVAAAARVARLATRNASGGVDLVPFVFAWLAPGADPADGGAPLGRLVSAVDHKPKRHQRLARLANVARDPVVSVLVDHYDDVDWTALWWIRISGRAEVVEAGARHVAAVDALVAKYPQYRDRRPAGPVLDIVVEALRAWSAGVPPQASAAR